VNPIVFINPDVDPGAVDEFQWSSADAVDPAELVPGLDIQIPDLGVSGQVIAPVESRPYLTTKSVQACALEFQQNLANIEGAPVLTMDGRLVGMLFNLRAANGQTLAYCFPAALI
jgi:hypothetical protein